MVRFFASGYLGWVFTLGLFMLHETAGAVPSFARQTGMRCAGCHTVFPELNSFGRQFKLRAYALGNANVDADYPANLPVSAILQVSRTMTANTSGVDPEMLPRDRKTTAQAAAVYFAGRITERTGGFMQYGYDGIERTWVTEMADFRFADSTTVAGGRELLYGATLNNGPTMSDVFNSSPMWSYPHVEPAGLMPAASPLLDMQLNAQAGGATIYGLVGNLLYAEAGVYRTTRSGVFRPFGWGAEKERVIDGYAPYWRLALQRDFGAHSAAVGLMGLSAKIFLDPEDPDMSTDRFRDLGADAQYQYANGNHSFTSHALYLRERQRLDASFTQGMASIASATLTSRRLDAHYFYKAVVGGGVQWFSTRGDADPMRYGMGPVMGSASGRPDTAGWIAEVNYLPVQNVKLAIRRTAFRKFNGGSTDYDGFGRNASDNNNWYLLGWFMF
ncbi:MAG: hypothetical protein ACOZJZ_22000 [Pseudomonadota bacterium]